MWIAIYIIGMIASTWVMVGWNFAFVQGEFWLSAHERKRNDMSASWMFAIAFGALWPLMFPLSYLLTAGAKHGWRLK